MNLLNKINNIINNIGETKISNKSAQCTKIHY